MQRLGLLVSLLTFSSDQCAGVFLFVLFCVFYLFCCFVVAVGSFVFVTVFCFVVFVCLFGFVCWWWCFSPNTINIQSNTPGETPFPCMLIPLMGRA